MIATHMITELLTLTEHLLYFIAVSRTTSNCVFSIDVVHYNRKRMFRGHLKKNYFFLRSIRLFKHNYLALHFGHIISEFWLMPVTCDRMIRDQKPGFSN